MLARAGLDAAAHDELIDFGLLKTDHSTEAVRGQLPFVDEAVQRAGGDAKTSGGFRGAQPRDLLGGGAHELGV